jgi:hypothetical protein
MINIGIFYLSLMILMMLFANKNITGKTLNCTSSCHRVLCSVIFFALLCTGCVLLSQEIFLQETKCMLVDKSYSSFHCTGQIDMCRGRRGSGECFEDCNTSYYKLALDFVVLDDNFYSSNVLNKSHSQTGCGIIDPGFKPSCKCCSHSLQENQQVNGLSNNDQINTCETKTLYNMKYDTICPPIITSNFDTYEQFEIGKSYRCWMGDTDQRHGHVYMYDKSHFRESASIVLIVFGAMTMICNLIYFVDKCKRNNCTCTNPCVEDDDDNKDENEDESE